MLVEPVKPYAIEIPKIIIAEAKAPNKKYFSAASLEDGSFFKNPTRT